MAAIKILILLAIALIVVLMVSSLGFFVMCIRVFADGIRNGSALSKLFSYRASTEALKKLEA